MTDTLFVLTGGPGAGKSTLLAALSARGLRHMPEAGRAIIRDQQAIGGTALPWDDRAAYAGMMLGWELRSHREASALPGPVLMDRGIPDIIGYLELCGLAVPAHLLRAAEVFRYNRRVFVAPFWEAIYAQDSERKQDPAEAEETCRVMERVYARLGYETVVLPRDDVEARARFVLEHLPR